MSLLAMVGCLLSLIHIILFYAKAGWLISGGILSITYSSFAFSMVNMIRIFIGVCYYLNHYLNDLYIRRLSNKGSASIPLVAT
jgi:hypothetical protein